MNLTAVIRMLNMPFSVLISWRDIKYVAASVAKIMLFVLNIIYQHAAFGFSQAKKYQCFCVYVLFPFFTQFLSSINFLGLTRKDREENKVLGQR